jgi:hypothetical protein
MSIEVAINEIRASATRHFGHCTFRFSQALPPISHLIGSDEKTKNGICQALTNRWIADHANGGSMWNHLYLNVHGQQCFDIAGVRRLMLEQKAGGSFQNQLLANERWLASQGVIPFEHPLTKAYAMTGEHAKVKDAAKALSDVIIGANSSDGHYLNLGLLKSSTEPQGHAVAVFIGARSASGGPDLVYFDSNLGEFWFPSKVHFKPWLIEAWHTLFNTGNYKYKSYWITAFAKKARGFQ